MAGLESELNAPAAGAGGLNLAVRVEQWPIRGGFTISRGSKTEAVVVVASVSDGGHTGPRPPPPGRGSADPARLRLVGPGGEAVGAERRFACRDRPPSPRAHGLHNLARGARDDGGKGARGERS